MTSEGMKGQVNVSVTISMVIYSFNQSLGCLFFLPGLGTYTKKKSSVDGTSNIRDITGTAKFYDCIWKKLSHLLG